MVENEFDVIVCGLGAHGIATTQNLAKKKKRVLGIDQHTPPHSLGSSHGETRITRQAIGEGEELVPFALRSHTLWKEIEHDTRRKLLYEIGGLIISSKDASVANHIPHFLETTVRAAEKFNIPHDVLNAQGIRKRFPQFNVQDNVIGYFEPGAGFLRPEECILAQLELAQKYGADIHTNEKMLEFESREHGVHVKTDRAKYTAETLILSAGPWLRKMIAAEYAKFFTVRRQIMYWFKVKNKLETFRPDRFPIFIWELPNRSSGIYGFPALPGSGNALKIATEELNNSTTPETINRNVSDEEIRQMYLQNVAPYFPDVSDECVEAKTCMYTMTPDAGFVIDRLPEQPNVIIVSPCSGHGFKHSAAIGEAIAEMVTNGESRLNLSPFSLKRFAQKE